MSESVYHVPVMLDECMEGLAILPSGVYVDVTFGGGGHSKEILKRLGRDGVLVGFDQDPDVLNNVIVDSRFKFVHQNFRYMKNHLRLLGIDQVDGILADLGISSHQIDVPHRGFATRFDGQLDMRMDQVSDLDARMVLNTYEEVDLHRVFGEYGEVKNAKTLSKRIVMGRSAGLIDTVDQLKSLIVDLAPKGRENKYFAQVFQALRVEVNRELEVLMDFLEQTVDVLKPGGRLVVMSYHSLEDRLVKNFMQKGKFRGGVEKDFFGNPIVPFSVLTRKPIVAAVDEVGRNSRARSAKLRIAEKLI